MIHVTVTLSDWMYRSVVSKSVLTLHRDYFRLRKPLERRVYEIARKHCGRQAEWRIGLETLLKKTGSTSPRRVFRKMIRDMVAEDGLPDYSLALDRRRRGAGAGPRPAGRGRGRGRGWTRRSMPGCARWRRATIPTGSRRSGCGSGRAAAGRRCAARRRRSLAFCRARAGQGARGAEVPRAEHPRKTRRFQGSEGAARRFSGVVQSMHIACTLHAPGNRLRG